MSGARTQKSGRGAASQSITLAAVTVVGGGQRVQWRDLPAQLQAAVEQVLGAPVTDAVSQPGGFSPGSADRVRTADGRRAFVKAVSSAQNPDSPGMHRREARIAAALPRRVPAPGLLGSYDDGDWIALIFQDVDGRHPATPWLLSELERCVEALDAMVATAMPASLDFLKTYAEASAIDFRGWERLSAEPGQDLDPWAVAHLPTLAELAASAPAATHGEALVHDDVRADNLLLTDGRVLIVDWPHATRGAPWIDTVQLLVNAHLLGGHNPERMLARSRVGAEADPASVTAYLAALAGYFFDGARRPAPKGLPSLREFQRVQGIACVDWLRQRTGWR